MRILITGASGLVGGAVLEALLAQGQHEIAVAGRRDPKTQGAYQFYNVGNLSAHTDWTQVCSGVDVVIHCAARVHVVKETVADPLAQYRSVNTDATVALAQAAIKGGAARFIFISTMNVDGAQTSPNQPLRADDPYVPSQPYDISKHEAEIKLMDLAKNDPLETVIIRPPLVYGANAKGNFKTLVGLVQKSIVLPAFNCPAKRSFVSIDNLTHLILKCIDHPKAANQAFLVSDGHDLTTTELLQKIVKAKGVKRLFIPLPYGFFVRVLGILGKRKIADKLFGFLQVDISKNKEMLGWTPPFKVEQALRKCFEND